MSNLRKYRLISLHNQKMASGTISSDLAETSNMEIRPTYAEKNIRTGVRKNGNGCSGLMSLNLKYIAKTEDSLFAEYLESCTKSSIVEVTGWLRAAFLHMELGIWLE